MTDREKIVFDENDSGSHGITLRAFLASQAQASWIKVLSSRNNMFGFRDNESAIESARLAVLSADAIIYEMEHTTNEHVLKGE